MNTTLNIDQMKPYPWGCYVQGYHDLIISIFENSHWSKTYFNKNSILPLLFLIRHYLEISLKEILGHNEFIFDDSPPKTVHSLKALFKDSFNALNEMAKRDEDLKSLLSNNQRIRNLGHWIDYFEKVDPLSFSFRYPTKKSGANSFGTLIINHDHLKKNFETNAKFLSEIQVRLTLNEGYFEK